MFMKNRLSKQVGLYTHSLELDPFANNILPELRNMELGELIQKTLKDCSVKKCVDKIQKSFTEEIRNNKITFPDFLEYLGLTDGVKYDPEEYVTYNKDYTEFLGVSEKAAIVILLKSKYIDEIKPENPIKEVFDPVHGYLQIRVTDHPVLLMW